MTQKIVIKLGGNILKNLHPDFFAQCAQLKEQGFSIIIVHGGGSMISDWAQKIGKDAQFMNGYRVTDQEMLTIAEMVLAGTVNKQTVSKLASVGLTAIGLSGIDLKLIEAKQQNTQLGYVGEVTKVNISALHTILEQGWVPVVASLGVGTNESHYNINADEVASAIAQAMNASHLIMVSDVDGIYIKTSSERKMLHKATPSLVEYYIQTGEISGGMIPKARSSIKALQYAVQEVWIVNGTKPLPFDEELFVGTRLHREVSDRVTLS